ncbi:MAG: methionine--tRNA ligase [Clostridiales bacterium GWF2_38_85]|nr:MAG: methionine--tRNA ligase [Clostridiales bacterium GWF2_38_85]HBL84957.1 methionine--tRNA ligase [Clostridiales bacterium]
MKEKFYITTAIVYSSKKPHIGNIYDPIMADCIARYKRLAGYDVFYLTGTDEHGQKIQAEAEKAGITPQQYVDNIAGEIKGIWDKFKISYDKFIRTTDEDHIKCVQSIFKRLYEQGDIYKSSYEGMYCTPCESFWTESQLVDGCCPDCGAPVVKASEEAYFLKLSKYQDKLMRHIEENIDFILPVSRKNEMINNFLKPGLNDLCVSRTSFNWGIPVEFDDKHVIYVWIDALSNYITGIGYDIDNPSDSYKKYWSCDLHVIGKDIIRFHTIYWPIILLALGEPLPKTVLGHPWLLSGNVKMSKSKGNVMYGDDLVDIFGLDPIRYYLLSELSYGNDGNITFESVIGRTNTDLANTLGNLVSRTAAMIKQNFNGVIPKIDELSAIDEELNANVAYAARRATALLDDYKLADSLESIMQIFRHCNKYIDDTTPWVLAKNEDDRQKLGTVLSCLVENIKIGTILLTPFIPDTSEKISKIFGFEIDSLEKAQLNFSCIGNTINNTEILFARIDEKKKLEEINKFLSSKYPKKEEPKAEVKEEKVAEPIDINDFAKVSLKVAQVLECEPVPKSDKLLKLIVDIGTEKRQVVSGIAKYYKPEQLIGKKIILVANLKPAKLRGVESNGMILTSGEDDVKVVFIDDSVPNGATVR